MQPSDLPEKKLCTPIVEEVSDCIKPWISFVLFCFFTILSEHVRKYKSYHSDVCSTDSEGQSFISSETDFRQGKNYVVIGLQLVDSICT